MDCLVTSGLDLLKLPALLQKNALKTLARIFNCFPSNFWKHMQSSCTRCRTCPGVLDRSSRSGFLFYDRSAKTMCQVFGTAEKLKAALEGDNQMETYLSLPYSSIWTLPVSANLPWSSACIELEKWEKLSMELGPKISSSPEPPSRDLSSHDKYGTSSDAHRHLQDYKNGSLCKLARAAYVARRTKFPQIKTSSP